MPRRCAEAPRWGQVEAAEPAATLSGPDVPPGRSSRPPGRLIPGAPARAALRIASMLGQQFVDESGRLQLVELADAFAEPILCQPLDLVLVEPVLVHDLEDEIALLVR